MDGEGGKLPGLGGGSITTGCEGVNPHGWTARYMWDPMRLYLYHQRRQASCGDGISLNTPPLSVGVWHHLIQHVRVNTPGVADGFIETVLDGQVVQRTDSLVLRGRVAPHVAMVDTLVFNIFRGGKGDSWAVPRDTQITTKSIYVLDCPPMLEGDENTVPRCDGEDTMGHLAAATTGMRDSQGLWQHTGSDGVFGEYQAEQARYAPIEEMTKRQQELPVGSPEWFAVTNALLDYLRQLQASPSSESP
jgi:hypothetical protein